MVDECTSKEQLIQQFTEQVHMIWEQWLNESGWRANPQEAELERKERLIALRAEFLDSLGHDLATQIMRAEAAKYNNIRSK